jgi:hypothetical protein
MARLEKGHHLPRTLQILVLRTALRGRKRWGLDRRMRKREYILRRGRLLQIALEPGKLRIRLSETISSWCENRDKVRIPVIERICLAIIPTDRIVPVPCSLRRVNLSRDAP